MPASKRGDGIFAAANAMTNSSRSDAAFLSFSADALAVLCNCLSILKLPTTEMQPYAAIAFFTSEESLSKAFFSICRTRSRLMLK